MTVQLDTRARAVVLRRRYPCMTMDGIGQALGVSRERVRQVLAQEGETTKRLYLHPRYLCLQCGAVITAQLNKKFCNMACQYAYTHVTIFCDGCGEPFQRQTSQLAKKWRGQFKNEGSHVFCTRQCFGSWVARHYGFGVHPENIKNGVRSHPLHEFCKRGHRLDDPRNYNNDGSRQCRPCRVVTRQQRAALVNER